VGDDRWRQALDEAAYDDGSILSLATIDG